MVGISLLDLFRSGAVLVIDTDDNLDAEMAALELAVIWSENIRYGLSEVAS